MATYGYARVSTVDQNEGRQLATLYEKYNVEQQNILVDKCSGKNTDRPSLQKLLTILQNGDTVVVSELARLGRNTKDLLELTDKFISMGVNIIFDKEKIDSTTATGRCMLTVFAAFAEFERAMILERQREGIKLAKEEGKYQGRKPIEHDPDLLDYVFRQYMEGKINVAKACHLLKYKKKDGSEQDLSNPTFHRIFEKWLIKNKIKKVAYIQEGDDSDADL